MPEERLLPAARVQVTMHPPSGVTPRARRVPKGKRIPILIFLAPSVIVAVVLIVLLGGVGGLLFVAGFAIVAAVVAVAVLRQKSISRKLYSTGADDWMSRSAFYIGPFDHTGLVGAAAFERQHSTYNNPPQVRLLVTSDGVVFGPAAHSGTPMSIPFANLESVDLVEGTRPRMHVVTPAIADRVGQVTLRTTDGRLARFSGLPVDGVLKALSKQGAARNNDD